MRYCRAVAGASQPARPAQAAERTHGQCSICGEWGWFERDHPSIREGFRCPSCQASLRYRYQAATIIADYSRDGSGALDELVREPEFGQLRVYEPGIIGPFRPILGRLPGYFTSYYWPDVEPGGIRDGVQSETLEALTLASESVDLVITSDIFEHVRHPFRGFAEVFRILAPGGRHVFTVPLAWPLRQETVARVDVSGPEDRLLAPAAYHSSPTDPKGSLVYNEFGLDLLDRLAEIGFETELRPGVKYNMTFSSLKPR
jgi:SAM-dependent methyltransferase